MKLQIGTNLQKVLKLFVPPDYGTIILNLLSSFFMKNMEKLKHSRGEHVRMVRSMTGLTIIGFAKELGVSRGSIIGWEQGKSGGLTEKGAEKIVALAKNHNILCTSIWLLHGIGNQPTFKTNSIAEPKATYIVNKPNSNLPETVTQEVKLFESNYDNAVTHRVEDDCMQPFFTTGDIVGGIKLFGSDINNALGKHCIIETESNEIFIRKLTQASSTDVYNLISTNLDTPAPNSILINATVISVAPIVWIRHL